MKCKIREIDPMLKIVLNMRDALSHHRPRDRLRYGCAICRQIADGKLAPFVSHGILVDKEFALKFLATYEKTAFAKTAVEKKEPKNEGRVD